jgi:hypothetical protein
MCRQRRHGSGGKRGAASHKTKDKKEAPPKKIQNSKDKEECAARKKKTMMNKNLPSAPTPFLLYTAADGKVKVEVFVQGETP